METEQGERFWALQHIRACGDAYHRWADTTWLNRPVYMSSALSHFRMSPKYGWTFTHNTDKERDDTILNTLWSNYYGLHVQAVKPKRLLVIQNERCSMLWKWVQAKGLTTKREGEANIVCARTPFQWLQVLGCVYSVVPVAVREEEVMVGLQA